MEDERNEMEINQQQMSFCPHCIGDLTEWNLNSNKVITKIERKLESARQKFDFGPPDNPGFFVIKVYEILWARASEETRRARIDSFLCSCGSKYVHGNLALYKLKPDVEEFSAVIERHGTAYDTRVHFFAQAIRKYEQKQLSLELVGGGKKSTATTEPDNADKAA
jgi:hypothetical protein